MVSTGVIIAAVVCCILVVVGTILGVWGSGVACPDFGMDCMSSPAPAAGTPAGSPAARSPAAGTPAGSPAAGTPAGSPAAGTPGLASSPASSLGSLGSTPDATATATNTGAPAPATGAPTTTVVNCEMNDWGTPTTCSRTCGGGTQTRTRTIKTQPSNGGTACPTDLSETVPCNTQPCPIPCVGEWQKCDKICGSDGKQIYKILTPASNGGADCKDAAGNILTNASTKSCGDLGPCAQNCEGAWVTNATTDAEGWSSCPPCGAGNQTRTWQNNPNKPQIPPGLACLRGNGVTETRSCISQPACIVPAPCEGSWGTYGGCSIGCGTGGTQSKTYTVSKNAVGTGRACIDPDDGVTDLSANIDKRIKPRPCDPAPPMCCADVSALVGPWVDGGGDCGSNNPYGRPYRYQSRTLISGAKATQADVGRCGFEILRTLLTSRGCPNQTPNSVECSSGGTWDGTKCTVKPMGGSCPPGVPYTYQGGGAAGDQACSYTKNCPATAVRNSESCPSCAC